MSGNTNNVPPTPSAEDLPDGLPLEAYVAQQARQSREELMQELDRAKNGAETINDFPIITDPSVLRRGDNIALVNPAVRTPLVIMLAMEVNAVDLEINGNDLNARVSGLPYISLKYEERLPEVMPGFQREEFGFGGRSLFSWLATKSDMPGLTRQPAEDLIFWLPFSAVHLLEPLDASASLLNRYDTPQAS